MVSEPEQGPVLKDQVLVEAQIDEKVVAFRAVVVNVQPSSLWLGLVRPDVRLRQLEPDQPVHLTFRRDNAAVVASSAFLCHMGSSHSRLFSVERPSLLQLVQRRAHLRFDVQRPIRVRVVNQSTSGSAGRTGTGTTRNLSAGGVQFATALGVVAGDDIELELELGPGDLVLAEAKVVRIGDGEALMAGDQRSEPAGGQLRTGEALVAARFTSIADGYSDRIVRFIFSMQRLGHDKIRRPA